MANKQHKPEEMVTKLRQVEVLVGQGMARMVLSEQKLIRAVARAHVVTAQPTL